MAKHDPVTPEEIEERIDDLKMKLRAREGYAAFGENCIAIKAEIARLEALKDAA